MCVHNMYNRIVCFIILSPSSKAVINHNLLNAVIHVLAKVSYHGKVDTTWDHNISLMCLYQRGVLISEVNFVVLHITDNQFDRWRQCTTGWITSERPLIVNQPCVTGVSANRGWCDKAIV